MAPRSFYVAEASLIGLVSSLGFRWTYYVFYICLVFPDVALTDSIICGPTYQHSKLNSSTGHYKIIPVYISESWL